MKTVRIATRAGFFEVPSIASAHGVHLVANREHARTYNLVEEFYGTSIAMVTKKVGLAFLRAARTGRTLKRFHAAHKYLQMTNLEESRKMAEDKDRYRKWHASWMAPTRCVKMLEMCYKGR